jgi:RimJ/RimL family protein N-acetyltransferase
VGIFRIPAPEQFLANKRGQFELEFETHSGEFYRLVPYNRAMDNEFYRAMKQPQIWWPFQARSVIDSPEKVDHHFDRALGECMDGIRLPYAIFDSIGEFVGIVSITDIIRETKLGKLVRRFVKGDKLVQLNRRFVIFGAKLGAKLKNFGMKFVNFGEKLDKLTKREDKQFEELGKRVQKTIVDTAKLIQLGKVGKFGWLVLSEKYQGRGIATAALARVEEWAFEGGRFDILLGDVADINKQSGACAERRGFERVLNIESRPGADGVKNTMGLYLKERPAT